MGEILGRHRILDPFAKRPCNDREFSGYSFARDQPYKLIYWNNAGCDLPSTNGGGQDRESCGLLDCNKDPLELFSVINDPAYSHDGVALQAEREQKLAEIGGDPMQTKETI